MIFVQDAFLGAQAAQTALPRPAILFGQKFVKADSLKPNTEDELTDMPIEDDLVTGDSEGEAGDGGQTQR